MLNLQSLLRLQAVFISPLIGYLIGREHGGWLAGVAGGLLALFIGLTLVETPYWFVAWLDRRRLRTASSDMLRAALDDDFRHYGHLNILRELQKRGEVIEFELPKLVGFLASSSVVNRVVGYAGIMEFFPVIGERLADYNPHHQDAKFDSIVAQLVVEFQTKQ